MPAEIVVHPLADDVAPEALAGATVVVIDVLRASTTVVHALAAGANEILPCADVETARNLAAAFPPGRALLGGERLGLPIEGFDLGNSPSEYTPERVAGRALVLTTTNGTRALERCRLAEKTLLGAFVNLAAASREAPARGRLHVLCAGTRGEPTEEDLLLAGAIAERLPGWDLSAEAQEALEGWRALEVRARGAEPDPRLVVALAESRGGRNVLAGGFERDLFDAARIDRFDLVPELDPASFRIRRLGSAR